MNVLLDSHALVWALIEDPRLSSAARKTFNTPAVALHLSIVSLWELSIKISIGKLRTIGSSISYFRDECREHQIEIIPLKIEHILRAESLPLHHRDPFDRLLIAQALEENLTVLTHDAEFGRYPVKVIW
jgi:PIN domain nuclease of toxin-antitoxin system